MPGKGQYRRSKAEYLDLIRDKYGDKFSIAPFKYAGGETWIEVTCPEHGEFAKKIDKLLKDKHGCPKCSREVSAKIRSKQLSGVPNGRKAPEWTPQKALRWISLPSGFTADTTQSVSRIEGRVIVTCPEHGPTIYSNARSARSSKTGCPTCGTIIARQNQTTTWDEFIVRARAKFGDRFEYSDDYGYVNLKSYVSIICPEHGPQKIRATKHLVHGQYCAECRFEYTKTSGLLPGLYAEVIPFDEALQATPGRLYYFQHGTKFKIGITKNTMQTRLKGQPQRERVTRVESVEMTMGEALAIEQYTLLKFAEHRIARVWSTELFDRDVLAQFGHASLESYVSWFRENEEVDLILSELAHRVKCDQGNTADTEENTC